jgi:hypothetical protein
MNRTPKQTNLDYPFECQRFSSTQTNKAAQTYDIKTALKRLGYNENWLSMSSFVHPQSKSAITTTITTETSHRHFLNRSSTDTIKVDDTELDSKYCAIVYEPPPEIATPNTDTVIPAEPTYISQRRHKYTVNYRLWDTKRDGGPFFSELKMDDIPSSMHGSESDKNDISSALCTISRCKDGPSHFRNEVVDSHDPVSWSCALEEFGMKLAYCPTDTIKLKHYGKELTDLDDMFLICTYAISDLSVETNDDDGPNKTVYGYDAFVIWRGCILDIVSDSCGNNVITTAIMKHKLGESHVKGIYRVVPVTHKRGL